MERKIGEIFEHNGEWYQCVNTGFSCADCDIKGGHPDTSIGVCSGSLRTDGKQVRFKKLEKVGEPHFIYDIIFKDGKIYVQNFKVYEDFEGHKPMCSDYVLYDWHKKIISIEIKQNKEDMEENKLNLKPFNLEQAKAGKPVCTRDGRKARIICFDAKGTFPIIALIDGKVEEFILSYTADGKFSGEMAICNKDLMMLPEKKEGWVNVYKDSVYDTKDEALIGRSEIRGYIDTIKISWEE